MYSSELLPIAWYIFVKITFGIPFADFTPEPRHCCEGFTLCNGGLGTRYLFGITLVLCVVVVVAYQQSSVRTSELLELNELVWRTWLRNALCHHFLHCSKRQIGEQLQSRLWSNKSQSRQNDCTNFNCIIELHLCEWKRTLVFEADLFFGLIPIVLRRCALICRRSQKTWERLWRTTAKLLGSASEFCKYLLQTLERSRIPQVFVTSSKRSRAQ